MKKKLICLVLTILCMAMFTACNSDDSSAQSEPSSTITPDYSQYLDRAEGVSDATRDATQESLTNEAAIENQVFE